MDNRNKSELLNKDFLFVGFGFLPHPEKLAFQTIQTVYKEIGQGNFTLCVGEIESDKIDLSYNESLLGKIVPGSAIAPFAQRGISGLSYIKVKEVFNQSMPGMKWYR